MTPWRLLCCWLVMTSGAFVLTLYAAKLIRFTEHTIVDDHRYTFGIGAVDIDGDGDIDITCPDIYKIGPDGESNLYWFENSGQGEFQRHVIYEGQLGWMERHASGDINGDGRPDVAMVDNRWGRLYWFANPEKPSDSHWKKHVITSKCSHAYDVVLADLDGDGDMDAAASGFGSGMITWFENPGNDETDAEWIDHVVDEKMSKDARTIEVADFNRDGKVDLLATTLGRRNRSAEEKNHGSQVVWYENCGDAETGRWKKQTIDDQSRAACHGHPADMDGDGDLDVVMAHGMMTTADPKVARHEVVWYENVVQPDANPTWKRHRIAPLPFAFEATAKDLDNDGDMDVVATAWTNTQRLYGQPVTDPDGARVVWFENRGDDPWVIHNLQEKFPGANQVIISDFNSDGRPDIVASCDGAWVDREQVSKSEIRWWRNDGK